jgi:hypothetical protein
MKKIRHIVFIQGISALFCMPAFFQISAQETNDGDLGRQSSGRVNMSLEITNRPNPTLQLGNPGGGVANIPGFLEGTLLRALGQNRNVEIPVCFAQNGASEFTVSVDSDENDDMMLTGLDGEQIPFEVNINGSHGNGNDFGKKVQYIQPENGACDTDSALKMQITLPETPSLASAVLLRGRFRLIITAE